tara:strand:+ start:4777 stop:12996 length:8220 start_codon:yes stop_codon:yes gene_type:complete
MPDFWDQIGVLDPAPKLDINSGWDDVSSAVDQAQSQFEPDYYKERAYATAAAQAATGIPWRGISDHAIAQSTPPEYRHAVLEAIQKATKEKKPMKKLGSGGRLASAFAQGAFEFGLPLARMLSKATGGPIEELDEEQERFRQAIVAVKEKEDPSIDKSFLMGNLQKTAQMTFPMIMAVGAGRAMKGAGAVAGAGSKAQTLLQATGVSGSFLPQIYDDSYRQLIGEGFKKDQAKRIATFSAPIEAAIESILPDPLTGYSAAFRGTARQVAGNLLRQATKNYSKELSEEALQAIWRETVNETARIMDEKIPDKGYGNALVKGLEAVKESAVPLAMMMGPGMARSGLAVAAESGNRPQRLSQLQGYRDSSRELAEFLSTDEGTRQWVAENFEEAINLPESPSRSEWKRAGLPSTMGKEERTSFVQRARSLFDSVDVDQQPEIEMGELQTVSPQVAEATLDPTTIEPADTIETESFTLTTDTESPEVPEVLSDVPQQPGQKSFLDMTVEEKREYLQQRRAAAADTAEQENTSSEVAVDRDAPAPSETPQIAATREWTIESPWEEIKAEAKRQGIKLGRRKQAIVDELNSRTDGSVDWFSRWIRRGSLEKAAKGSGEQADAAKRVLEKRKAKKDKEASGAPASSVTSAKPEASDVSPEPTKTSPASQEAGEYRVSQIDEVSGDLEKAGYGFLPGLPRGHWVKKNKQGYAGKDVSAIEVSRESGVPVERLDEIAEKSQSAFEKTAKGETSKKTLKPVAKVMQFKPGEQRGLPGMEKHVAEANERERRIRIFRRNPIHERLAELAGDSDEARAWADSHFEAFEKMEDTIIAEAQEAAQETIPSFDYESVYKALPLPAAPDGINVDENTHWEIIVEGIEEAADRASERIKEFGPVEFRFKIGDAVFSDATGVRGTIRKFIFDSNDLYAEVGDGGSVESVRFDDLRHEETEAEDLGNGPQQQTSEPQESKADLTTKSERLETEGKDVRHILQWTENGKSRERSFAAYSMAKRYMDQLGSSASDKAINTVTTPRAELEVKPTDAPKSIEYTKKGGFDASAMDPAIAGEVISDIKVTQWSPQLNKDLRDALQEIADKQTDSEHSTEYQRLRDAYYDINLGEVERNRENTKRYVKKLHEEAYHRIAKSRGVPNGRRHGSLSGAKKWKDAILNAKSDAWEDPDVVAAVEDKNLAEKKYQELSSQKAKAEKDMARQGHQDLVEKFGEKESGDILVSRTLGPATAIRIDGWSEEDATYYVSQGAFVESTGQFYQQYEHLQEMTPYAVFRAYGSIDESRSVQAVKMQVDEALAKAKQIEADEAAQKAAEERVEYYQKRLRTKSPVKATPARVLPLERQYPMTYKENPAVGNPRVVVWGEIPKSLEKRSKEIAKKKGSHSPIKLESYQDQWTDKTAKKFELIGYLEDIDHEKPSDRVHTALLSDGKNVVGINSDYHDYFAGEGFTFAIGDKLIEGDGGFILLRKNDTVVGAVASMRFSDESATVPFSEADMWITGKKPATTTEKKREAIKRFKAKAKDLVDRLSNRPSMNPMFEPKVWSDVIELVIAGTEAGWYTFQEFIENLSARIGKAEVVKNSAAIREAWDEARAIDDRMDPSTPIERILGDDSAETTPPDPPAEPINSTGEESPLTSIKNEIVNELRKRRGIEELPEVGAETQQEWLDAAERALTENPNLGTFLVEEITDSPRNLSNIEVAVMQIHYRQVNNSFDETADALSSAVESSNPTASASLQSKADLLIGQLNDIEQATKAAGREWGRAGVARQIVLAKDFSLAGMMRKARVSNAGKPLSAEQQNEIAGLAKRFAEIEKKLQESEARRSELESQRRVQEGIDKDKKRKKKKPARTQAARKKVDDAWDAFNKMAKGKLYSNPLELAAPAIKLISAYVDLGVTTFGEFMANVRKRIGDAATVKARETFKTAWDEMKKKGDIPPTDIDLTDLAAITRLARRIQRTLVESGITKRDAVVDAVHESLQEIMPGITRRESMDALSGYGQFTPLSKDEIDATIRDINGQLQQLAKLEDMEKGIAPAKTGPERRTPSEDERRLIKQVNEAKKRGGFAVTDPASQLRTAMQAAKTAVRNRITDLEHEIKTGERIVRDRVELIPDKELESLRNQRDELLVEHKKLFPPQGATQEQKVAAANSALDRAIAQLEQQLKEGDISPKPRSKPISTPELDAKRARLESLRSQRKALQDAANPRLTPEERARRSYEANLKRRIADYKKRIDNKEFAPRKREPRPLSSSELKLKQQLEDVKHEFFEKTAEYRLANMSPLEKSWDYVKELSHLSRAALTSVDLSAVFRQGGALVFSHPLMAKKSGKAMLQALSSRQAESESIEKIRNRTNGQLYLTAGLELTADQDKLTRQEEAFMGRWAKKVPFIRASNRAYATFLNNIRADVFDHMVSNLGRSGTVTLDESKVIARFVNVATGRSDLGRFNNVAANLNMVFFAPRYVASRFQYLAMPFYLPFTKTTPRVKRAILAEYGRHAVGVGTFIGLILSLGSLLGDDEEEPKIEMDPRASDFMKIRIGETRLDPMSGLSQTMVLLSRLTSGQSKSSSGKVYPIRGDVPYGGSTSADVISRFLRTKLAPVPGSAVDWLSGENVVGEPVRSASVVPNMFIPLSLREVSETVQSRGVAKGSAISAAAILGMGVSNYGPKTKFRKANPKERDEMTARLAAQIARIVKPDADERREIRDVVNQLKFFGVSKGKALRLLDAKLRAKGMGRLGRDRWRKAFVSRYR